MLRHCLVIVAVLFTFCMTPAFSQAPLVADVPAAQAEGGGVAKPDAQSSDYQPTRAEVDAWEDIWAGQRGIINEINAKAMAWRKRVAEETAGLSEASRLHEEEFRRLFLLATTFKDWPNPLEAVSRRIAAIARHLRLIFEPVVLARADAQRLLDRVSQIVDNLPEEVSKGRVSAEMQAYVKDVGQAKSRLTVVVAQYDAALAPFQTMLKRFQETRDDIGARLPLLWTKYYLQDPVVWTDPEVWEEAALRADSFLSGIQLRLPVELPVTLAQWGATALRFVVFLFFTGLLTVLFSRRCAPSSSTARHIFRISLPYLCLGGALIGSSVTGDFFRLLLALGNLVIIMGQVFLAWDLRLLQHPQDREAAAPFWRLIPLMFCAYALLYLPLENLFKLLVWAGLLVVALAVSRRRAVEKFEMLQLENGALEMEPVLLWICLAFALAGLHIYSMALYLLFVSCSLSVELCLGGMSLINRASERLSREGVRSALTRLCIALAAPVVLAAGAASVLLWIGTLPGGLDMLRHYGFQGMNIGGTQFNIIQIVLILSAFYVTRAAVDMGTRFLSHLPSQQGLQIDATLIPSMQTAFTYALWCIFGLFALHSLGMELSSLLMVAGGLSVGIGFGMQTIVNNFISGLILIFSRILQAGDVIEVGGITGIVRKISVRATMVETYDNALIYVPNSEFVSSRLINWTRNSRSVRREIKIGVAYGSDVEQVTRLLLAVANRHTNVLKYPASSVVFSDFGASTLDFVLHIWVRDYDVGVSTASEIRLQIEEEFRKYHIEIAFPQLDVHIRNMPPRLAGGRHPVRRMREKYLVQKKRTI
ncbi:MAG: small-conductance mechanosensitive ion channel MscS [Candidatus Desulfovibrio kirbyi]|uniref:Small-conductance mechanosensitive ion channel MscS n=1 Tax=Candidatus Desulfovibrio kirbyi TaxID=2696086 RepID=A0A6L2R5S2_9BACT|nr:MAG: small-conductance mechanosensitive ion channel MscS [Candidatus Desulfovibrio kirbyi]